MSAYYFIENKNPINDPNIDLNFDNDLLYSDIIADDYDKYREAHVINESISPRDPAKKQPIQKLKNQQKPLNYNIYVIFIIVVILFVFVWYTYGGSSKIKSSDNFPSITSPPDLVMLSPDFGSGARFGSF